MHIHPRHLQRHSVSILTVHSCHLLGIIFIFDLITCAFIFCTYQLTDIRWPDGPVAVTCLKIVVSIMHCDLIFKVKR